MQRVEHCSLHDMSEGSDKPETSHCFRLRVKKSNESKIIIEGFPVSQR